MLSPWSRDVTAGLPWHHAPPAERSGHQPRARARSALARRLHGLVGRRGLCDRPQLGSSIISKSKAAEAAFSPAVFAVTLYRVWARRPGSRRPVEAPSVG